MAVNYAIIHNQHTEYIASLTYYTTYNLLNLPNLMHTTVRSMYEYDANGEKLSRLVDTNETDYISGIQYDNNRISFIQSEEGRVFPYSTDTSNYYQYFLADHLGNTRVAFDTPHDSLKVEQQDDYMPFGMEISQGSVANPKNEYLYNKKELQEDSQLYDYGARFYDATVGRFTTVDKLAEDPTQINLSPYAYVENDPISKDDPDGNCPSCFIGALVGAAVDYGEQVATNYVEGNAHPFTNNINLTSIGTAAVAGFVTSGGSVIENVGAKIAVKVGAALINNTVKITTSSTGLKTTVETNAVNVAKNTAIDLAADGAAGKVGGKIEGALSKVGVTNAGRLSSTAKKVVNALGQNVTRATTATVKAGLKATANVAGKTVESTVKAATNTQRDAIKDKTNKQ